MKIQPPKLFAGIERYFSILDITSLCENRKTVLASLIEYSSRKIEAGQPVLLNFICTHNSRRSQFAQVWAQTAAAVSGFEISAFSGGVEVTSFNSRAIETLRTAGFKIQGSGTDNPKYELGFSPEKPPIAGFSKMYDHPDNPAQNFAAVLTCSHADENCPFISGAEARFSLAYEDPKEFDGTSREAIMYETRSRQIATEMYYVFSQVRTQLLLNG